MRETAAPYHIEHDLPHKIITLLKRGPYMRQEIERYCLPHTPGDVRAVLREMEHAQRVRYLGGVGLYELVDA